MTGPGSASAYDVVIVGGGIVGVSIAYHLARQGGGRLLLLERGAVGGGSTARTAGSVRSLFDTPANVGLSRLSRGRWREFEAELGMAPGYAERGSLLLASQEATLAGLRARLPMQQALGVAARQLTPTEVARLVPALAVDDLRGAVYCPDDAFVDPVAAARAYAGGAVALGVEVREHVAVASLRHEGGRVVGVTVAGGQRIGAGTVVLAAGVWSATLLLPLGLVLPARRYRREIFESQRQETLRDTPFVSDLDLGWYFRTAGPRLWMSGSREDRESWSESVHWHLLDQVRARMARRLPLVSRLTFPHGRAGLYALTPDGHAILGWAPQVTGLFLACGDSGHGVMHAPATGQLVAEWLVAGRAASAAVGALLPERFDWRSPTAGTTFSGGGAS